MAHMAVAIFFFLVLWASVTGIRAMLDIYGAEMMAALAGPAKRKAPKSALPAYALSSRRRAAA